MKSYFLLFFFLFSFLLSFAQDDEKSIKKARKDSIRTDKVENGKLMLTPFGGFGVTPELGFSIATGAIFSFKTDRHDTVIQRSSNTFSFTYSTKNAIVLFDRFTSYWWEDKVRFNTDVWMKWMPDNYWGVGYDEGRYTLKGDSTTAYDRLWWQINPQVLFRVKKNLYAGLNIDLNQTESSNENPKMKADPYFVQYGSNNFNSGLGVMILYDSRDVPVNAWQGVLVQLKATMYGNYFGSNNRYQVYDFDYRHYLNIFKRKGSTLAWQIRFRSGQGNVPWAELSQLGSPFDFRGYTWGRYRDKDMQYNLVEYRYMIKGKNPFTEHKISRHGLVGWVGIGSVANAIDEFTNWLPNYGIGYRFEVQPRMNLRIDIGFGNDSRGVYVNFNEAF